MEAYEDRVINGILKSGLDLSTPAQVRSRLNRDFNVVVDSQRLEELWPCVWSLASVLQRQFGGAIYINAGLDGPLPGPGTLGSRVVFNRSAPPAAFTIGIGIDVPNTVAFVHGDVRGSQLTYGRVLHAGGNAHPVACFALAGYLGYTILGKLAGLPPYHESFTTNFLDLSFPTAWPPSLPESMAFIGLGQLGQAYLTLLYFLDPCRIVSLQLLDKDLFEPANRTTQILLPETSEWEGKPKATYLADKFVRLGWNANGERRTINWGWTKPETHGHLALLGLDKFDPRRMVTSAGYEWLFEAGVGTSFVAPRITWHSFPGQPAYGRLFPSDVDTSEPPPPSTEFENDLKQSTPGGCGWVTYNNISASAPAMGVLASAYLWAEILRYLSGSNQPVGGMARLWSPLLPFNREPLQVRGAQKE